MGMQVLSRVCGYAVEQSKLTVNPCEGIKALYSSDRAAIIWTPDDIARIKAAVGSAELGHAIDLAGLTGLRRADLLRLSWSHVHDNEIVIPTNKSGRRVDARIPLYAELRAVLTRIPKRATTILTNSKGHPWTDTAFGWMITAAQGRNRRGASLSRSARHRCNQVLRRRIAAARHRGDSRLDREQRGQHHPQVCRSHRRDRGRDSAAR
jgi:integrase